MKSNISVVVTVFNEAKTIESLVTALETQTIQPKEVVVVDGGSSDETWEILQRLIKSSSLKLHVFQKPGNRSVGRNYAIEKANSELIAITDAGCVPHADWLERLGDVYFETSAPVIAGYYSAQPQTPFEEAVVPYVLVMPDKVNPDTFLPATRSMMIEKKVWKELKGFNEKLSDNEDYDFAHRLKKTGYQIAFAAKARVKWIPRSSLRSFAWMIYRFARGDIQAGLIRPKVLLIFARYILLGLLPIGLLASNQLTLLVFLLGLSSLLYSTWAIFKNLRYVPNGWYWLPVLQVISDFAVMAGSLAGFKKKN
jgi:glycosyltransferase involved in cell wall biosynthesis